MKKFIFTVFLVLMVCLMMGASAQAGCNRCVTTYSTTYQYPVTEEIIVPIAVPVLIPAFQYQYVPAVAVPVTVPAVPLPAPAPVQTPVGQAPVDTKALARAILAELQSQQTEDSGPPVAIIGNFGAPAPVADGLTILNNRCASCHTGPNARQGMRIFNSPGVFNSAMDRQRALKAILEDKMPLDQHARSPVPMSREEKLSVQKFLIGN